MARGRSAPAPASRSASAAASRPRPAAQAPPAQAPPAHHAPAAHPTPAAHPQYAAHPPPMAAPAAAAPPAVQTSSGGGMFSGLMGSVVTGAAMGTGSAMASRAIDSLMGPRTVVHQHDSAPAAAAPAAATSDACLSHAKAFADCMSKNSDMGICQYYYDSMQQCKLNA